MDTKLWILQGIIAFIFFFSGINKSYFSEKVLVAKGQTGVEGLSSPMIRFIGISEIIGAIGVILPQWLQIFPVLTPIASICLGAIMIPAATIHYKRNEWTNVYVNVAILIVCLIIAYFRF